MSLRKSTARSSQSLRLILLMSFTATGCGSAPEEPQQKQFSASDAVQSEQQTNKPSPEQAHSEIETPQKDVAANVALAAPSAHQQAGSETATPPETKPVEFDEEIVAAFDKLVSPSDSVEQWEIANQALLGFGPRAVPLLADRLKNGDDIERETAASALVSLGPDAKAAIPELRLALHDILPFVQVNAAVALIQFPNENEKAIPTLVALLEHSDESVRQMASMNLAILGTEASQHVADLTRVLEKSDGSNLLLPVVELLGRIGPAAEDAVPKLKQIAFEQKGEISAAASSAIELIQTQSE